MPVQGKRSKQRYVDPVDAEFNKKKKTAILVTVSIAAAWIAISLILQIFAPSLVPFSASICGAIAVLSLFYAVYRLEEAYAYKLYARVSALIQQGAPALRAGSRQEAPTGIVAVQPTVIRPAQPRIQPRPQQPIQAEQVQPPIMPARRWPGTATPAQPAHLDVQPRVMEPQPSPFAERQESKRCPNCGRELPYGDLHVICPFCGTPLK
ncbi:hypothetical protein IG193_05785 [Infirmifilum lucidum]|uniref:Zinc ribbon domain-containing protein n=1 Tax=Infirmifilum lucidum TaxID=2776706 RepID=A0A7L9FEX3_9CREN|nr:hypothetical protein [Infirmifilum lucidum]QOJ78279.1 hypothetical protein IG193_05785 [Infirmifilum lucidum]